MRSFTAAALAACALLVACGEQPQTTTTRKSDVAPSAGSTGSHTAPGWKPGDAGSWDKQMSARAQGQNEYTRTNVR